MFTTYCMAMRWRHKYVCNQLYGYRWRHKYVCNLLYGYMSSGGPPTRLTNNTRFFLLQSRTFPLLISTFIMRLIFVLSFYIICILNIYPCFGTDFTFGNLSSSGISFSNLSFNDFAFSSLSFKDLSFNALSFNDFSSSNLSLMILFR